MSDMLNGQEIHKYYTKRVACPGGGGVVDRRWAAIDMWLRRLLWDGRV